MSAPVVRVRHDLFPARVMLPSPHEPSVLPKARVIVTLDEVHVFVDSPSGPATVFSARVDSLSRPSSAALEVHTPVGVVHASPSGGCACGSRLRSFRPFDGATLAMTAS